MSRRGTDRPGRLSAVVLVAGLCWAGALDGQQGPVPEVVLHPIMNDTFVCAEHAEGELEKLGDALGKDCLVIRMESTGDPDKYLPRLFRGDGLENEDWFGWEVPLLAPCEGTVAAVEDSPRTNRPGDFGPAGGTATPASEIEFVCFDGVRVVYAHARNIDVAPGDSVAAGEVVAEIGNNGVSKAPHVHVGAWRGETPLQVRFDLRVLGELRRSGRRAPGSP